jgi:hypothetical protein
MAHATPVGFADARVLPPLRELPMLTELPFEYPVFPEGSIVISVDVARIVPGLAAGCTTVMAGEVDFFVNPEVSWAIELLISGCDPQQPPNPYVRNKKCVSQDFHNKPIVINLESDSMPGTLIQQLP